MKKGWKVEKLGDVCEVFADGDWIESKDQSPEGVRLIQTGNVGNGIFKDRGEKARYISEATFKRLRCTEIFEGDCLVSRLPDPVGRACILPDTGEKMITAVDCTIIRFDKKKVIPEFFNYYSQSDQYLNDVDHETSGTTRKRISRSKLAEVQIPIPSLPEQQRIVSVLDEAFASIAQAKSNAEQNLVNARELFEALLNEYFGHARDGWKEMKLNDACVVERGSSPRPIKKYQTTSKDGVNWIKIGDTKGVEKYIYSTREKITKEGAKQSRFVKEGDFILTNSMSFGNPYIMKTEGYIHDGWFVLRLKEFIDTEFFWYLLVSPFVRNQFNQLASGAIVKNISGDLVKKAILFIPPLAEQRAIVGRLEALSAETKRLEEIYQSKVDALEELKKSVLGKAFAGEL